jgi:hypothetical protein
MFKQKIKFITLLFFVILSLFISNNTFAATSFVVDGTTPANST